MDGIGLRLVTGIFFVIIMVFGTIGHPFSFSILFFLINFLCLWEFLKMGLAHENTRDHRVHLSSGLIMGIFPFVIAFAVHLEWIEWSREWMLLCLVALLIWLFLLFIYDLFSESENTIKNIAFQTLGLLYIGLPFSLLAWMGFQDGVFNTRIILGMLILNWANDTGAYLVGSAFGKHKLLPRISPKKTWEGSLAAIPITIGIGAILSIFYQELDLTGWLMLAVVVSVFGQLGDLSESMLKRKMGLKDSGTLLPGHGGMLDRFDAFIFMLPFAAAFLLWYLQ
jgi:phosphatidate cytidylyltransferase